MGRWGVKAGENTEDTKIPQKTQIYIAKKKNHRGHRNSQRTQKKICANLCNLWIFSWRSLCPWRPWRYSLRLCFLYVSALLSWRSLCPWRPWHLCVPLRLCFLCVSALLSWRPLCPWRPWRLCVPLRLCFLCVSALPLASLAQPLGALGINLSAFFLLRRYERTDFLAEEGAAEGAFIPQVEHQNWQVVIHAQRKGGGVHHSEPAI